MKVNLSQLKDFLREANKAGYASGETNAWKKEADGSTTIIYEKGPWLFHDNFFGGEPYGGREVVFYGEKPVFIMVYYGKISGANNDGEFIYPFLRKALRLFPEDRPFRGPARLEEVVNGQKMRYENQCRGDIDYFSGKEKIFINGREVYEAKYAGGLVAQKS